jgi:hypothetical protein
MAENEEETCPKCGAAFVSEGVHGGISWKCGSFESAYPAKFKPSVECLTARLSAAERENERLRPLKEAAEAYYAKAAANPGGAE